MKKQENILSNLQGDYIYNKIMMFYFLELEKRFEFINQKIIIAENIKQKKKLLKKKQLIILRNLESLLLIKNYFI